MKTDNDGYTKYTFMDKLKDFFNNHEEGWLMLGIVILAFAIALVATR